MRRIGNDARRGEGQAVPPGNSGGDMRFHVDCHRAGRPIKVGLVSRSRRHLVAAEQQAPLGLRQARDKTIGPVSVGRHRPTARVDGCCHDPLAGSQSRCQGARDSDADDAVHAGSETIKRRCQSRMIAAARDRLDTRAGHQAPFALQAGDRQDRHMP